MAEAQAARTRMVPGGKMPDRPAVDYATVGGTVGAFALILLAMAASGSVGAFADIPAFLIVIGGTFLVTSVSFTTAEIINAQRVMIRAVIYKQEPPSRAALLMIELASLLRSQGWGTLESRVKQMRGNPFLQRAVSHLVDGLPYEQIEQLLTQEIAATSDRHLKSAGIIRRAGEVAPAMGLIGTLIGLVQMLGNLEDPASIGPAMAVALLTTFYGAVLANMVFNPLATKLERNAAEEAMVNRIYAISTAAMSRKENPRRLEILLNTVLSPKDRVSYFD